MCVFSVYVDLICHSYCIDPPFSGKIVYVDVFVLYSVLELYGVPFVPKLCRHVVCLCYVSSSVLMCLFTVYVDMLSVYAVCHFPCLCVCSLSMFLLSVYAMCRLPCLFTVYVHVVCLCYVSSSMSMCLFTVYVHVVCLCYVSSSVSMCLFTVCSCCQDDTVKRQGQMTGVS